MLCMLCWGMWSRKLSLMGSDVIIMVVDRYQLILVIGISINLVY